MSGMSQEDFEKLCRSINDTVASAARALGNGLNEAGTSLGNALNHVFNSDESTEKIPTVSEIKQRVQHAASNAMTPTKTRSGINATRTASAQNARVQQNLANRRFKSSAGLTAGGVLLCVFGGIFTFSFAVSMIIMMGFSTVIPEGVFMAVEAALAAFTGLSAWGLVAGIKNLRLSSRLKSFRRIFGNREVCSFKELAAHTQETEAKALADARKMLKRGLLPEGHIDEQGTCLMVTNESYQYYRNAMQAQRLREREQQANDRVKSLGESGRGEAGRTEEVDTFIKSGQSYLSQLRDLDIAIDDAQISSQIVEIEHVVERIIARVSEDPSCIDCLDRLMDYYLPTTIKLLAAYDELEQEPIQGENITNSRREIENTLSGLITAYEKLLDSTYQDLSMNVSADISVLNAMLAREGLTESPFDMKKE